MKGNLIKKLAAAVICICMTAALMTGCGAKTESGYGENVLVYGSGDYTSINPALYEHGEINALIFAGLTAHDAENNVVPGLAESWTLDNTTNTYTFKLREGLTFHDGHSLTSEDVKYTLEAILDEKNNSEIVTNYKDITEIACPDEQTVEISLSQPCVAFPDYMTIGILPKHILEGEDLATCEFNRKPVGAGPYKLTEWEMGQNIVLESFEGYYAGKANIDKVVFKIVEDDDARAMQLKSGDIHMAQLSPKSAENFRNDDNFNVYQMDTADYRAIAYNFNSEFFGSNPELANILSYGIDREAIINAVLLGEGQKAYSPIQKNKFNDESIEKFEYNPEKCKELLEAAGWTMGNGKYYEKDGEELGFEICAMSYDSVRVEMAQMCAEQLQTIGVNSVAKALPSLDWENQDSCIIGWGSPFDADDHTYKVFSTGAGDNYTSYSNENIDRILDVARVSEDEGTRKNLYSQFLNEMTLAMPYTFIAYVDADYVIKKNISGITPGTSLGHHGVGVFWNIADWEIK